MAMTLLQLCYSLFWTYACILQSELLCIILCVSLPTQVWYWQQFISLQLFDVGSQNLIFSLNMYQFKVYDTGRWAYINIKLLHCFEIIKTWTLLIILNLLYSIQVLSLIIQYLRKDWYRGIQGFDTVPGFPRLLEGWVAGEEAETMEYVPESVVLDICHELLQRFCNRPDIDKPVRIIR